MTEHEAASPRTEIKTQIDPGPGRLYVVMVGLPAMGKSTVASKIKETFQADGFCVEIFNNGELRRSMLREDTSQPDFYDPANAAGMAQRERISLLNIQRAREFLRDGGQIAILDATNVSCKRRAMLEQLLDDHPILYVECVNDDPEMLAASITRKAKLPEFAHLAPESAYRSFERRIAYYRYIYTPLAAGTESRFFTLDTLNNRILAEHIKGDVPFYVKIRDLLVSDWVKSLYLARHGQSQDNVDNRIGGDSPLTTKGQAQAAALASHFRTTHLPYLFCSTRRRAMDTARPIAARQDRCQVIALREFDEIDAGECEGLSYADVRQRMPAVTELRSRDKYNYVYPGGEGYVTLKERVDKGIKKALYLSGNSDNIMIVGHQAVNRMILSHFLFRRQEDVPYIYIPQDRYFHIISTQNKKLVELRRF